MYIGFLIVVTHPLYESRMCWIPDSRDSLRKSVQPCDTNVTVRDSVQPRDIHRTVRKTSETQASAIAASAPSGAPLTPSLPKKCRRRRRRQAHRAANQNKSPSSAAPVTPDERWANERAGSSGATQPLLEDSDPLPGCGRQCTRTPASTPKSSHSLPSQQPMKIRRFI